MPVSEMKTFKIIQSRKETEKHTHIFMIAKPLISMIQQ